MNFNKHSILEGTHAPFGASQSSWLRYSDDKALDVYKHLQAKMTPRLFYFIQTISSELLIVFHSEITF